MCVGGFAMASVATIMLARPAAAMSQDAGPGAIAPAREGLAEVPLPRLDALEPAVAEQLREEAELARAVTPSDRRALAEAYGSLAQTLHVYEFFDAAEASYRNASQLAPGEFRWLHLRAYMYQQTGRFQDAASLYTAARRVRPDDHVATVHLAETYLALGRLGEARDEFEAALPRYPAAAEAGLGEVALRQGRFTQAVTHFRAALARAPQADALHYSLAMAYRALGRTDEARAHLEKRGTGGVGAFDPVVEELETRSRGERAFVVRGRRAFDAGEFREAADLFRRALSVAPESLAARTNLGLALAQLGNAAEAAVQFEAVLAVDAANVTAHAGLGLLLARQGRDDDAVEHLQAAFRQTPSDAIVSGALAGALARLRRTDEAIAVLTEARSLNPSAEAPLIALSLLLADRERYREALSALEEANRLFPDRLPTATTLARLLASSPDRSLRDGQRALDLATAIYKTDPAPVYAETVALALAELGRCADALNWMKRAIAAAERANDAAETARLKGEMPKYSAAPCRPAGR
jgi:tetratricopeptide (TPR) repeat protein